MWQTDVDDLEDDEFGLIEQALIATAGVIREAAQQLNTGRTTLSRKISKSPRLSEALKSVREENCEIGESILFRKLRHVDKNTDDKDKPPNEYQTNFVFKYLDYYHRPKVEGAESKPPVDPKYL